MDDPRDVQTSKRNGSSRSLLSAGSAVAMEIKRKKIRQSTLFLQTEVWPKRYIDVLCILLWIIMTVELTWGGSPKCSDTNVNRLIYGFCTSLHSCNNEYIVNNDKQILTSLTFTHTYRHCFSVPWDKAGCTSCPTGELPLYAVPLKPEPCALFIVKTLLSMYKNNALAFALTPLKLMSFQAKSMKRCPSLLNDTLQIVEDMNLLYIRQISKKLQVHILVYNMENDDVCFTTNNCAYTFKHY